MLSKAFPFTDVDGLTALLSNAPAPDANALEAARARNSQLTKPPGALGRMEDIAIWIAGWQGREPPQLENQQVLVFAGNHGVTAQGVSAFPPEVTAQMVANFEAGGAAINQLCQAFGADMKVVPITLHKSTADFTSSLSSRARPSSSNHLPVNVGQRFLTFCARAMYFKGLPRKTTIVLSF